MREQDFYIDFAETVLFVFAFSLLALVIAKGIGFWRYTGRLWFPTRSVRLGFSFLCFSGVFFGLIGIGKDPIEYFLGHWFPNYSIALATLCTYLWVQYELSPGLVLKYLAMPLGFLITPMLILNFFHNFDYGEVGALFAASLMPAVVGGFLSALFLDEEYPTTLIPRWSRNWDLPFFLLVFSFLLSSVSLFPLFFLSAHPWHLAISLGFFGAIYLSLNTDKDSGTRLVEAAVYGFLASVGLFTIFYISGAQIAVGEGEEGFGEVRDIFQNGVDTILVAEFSLVIYIFALFNGIIRSSFERLIRCNWHLAEGYVFIIFILFAPKSLILDF